MYAGDRWIDWDADGAELAPSVRLLRTPGHTAQDISTVASTPEDVFACTHAWWAAGGPADDPLGPDAGALHVSRDLLLSFATVIVPGHGAAFRPDHPASSPRLARLRASALRRRREGAGYRAARGRPSQLASHGAS